MGARRRGSMERRRASCAMLAVVPNMDRAAFATECFARL